MSFLRHPVHWFRAHPTAWDTAVMLALLAFCIPQIWVGESYSEVDFRDPDAIAVLLVIVSVAPIAWRRRDPIPVLFISGVAAVLYEVAGYPTLNGFAPLIAMYTVAAHCDRRRSVASLAGVGGLVLVMLLLAPWVSGFEDWLTNTGVFVIAWLIGDNLQSRRKYVATLERANARAEQDKLDEARRAVDAERNRIAREMHDVVAHSMSVMVVQAGAARRIVQADPGQAAEAIGQVEATGREAMAEMRRLLGVLRQDDEGGALAPQPTLDGLDRLVDHCEQAGLPVTVAIQGERRDLPAGVELSAFRIVQEALTNTLKHAGPAQAQVRITYGDDAIDLEVLDDGRGAASNGSAPGGGHGILGMHERVDVCGGTMQAGPRPGGGFAVRAHLPLDAPAVSPA